MTKYFWSQSGRSRSIFMQHLHKVNLRNKRSLKFDFQFQLSLYKRTLHNMLRIFRSARLVRFISVCGPYFMSSSFFFTHLFTIILKKTCVFIFQYLPAIARRGYCDANIDLTEGEKKIISVLKSKFPSATKVEAQDISGQRSHFFFYKSYYIHRFM